MLDECRPACMALKVRQLVEISFIKTELCASAPGLNLSFLSWRQVLWLCVCLHSVKLLCYFRVFKLWFSVAKRGGCGWVKVRWFVDTACVTCRFCFLKVSSLSQIFCISNEQHFSLSKVTFLCTNSHQVEFLNLFFFTLNVKENRSRISLCTSCTKCTQTL